MERLTGSPQIYDEGTFRRRRRSDYDAEQLGAVREGLKRNIALHEGAEIMDLQ